MSFFYKNFLLLATFYFLFSSFILPVLAEETTELPNPLGTGMTTEKIVANVIKLILGLVGVLALIMFIYGGITWMTSGGNVEAVKRGKNTLVWAVLGLAVVFFAYSLVNFILTKVLGVR
ncbi:MAG: pilin [Patescibacteria group bacterium]|nr:pilin [Patescibacteria group bacterium]